MNTDKKIMLAVSGELPMAKVFHEILNEYSLKISKAIQPLTTLTAPFVYAMLMEYAKEVGEINENVKGAAADLMSAPKIIYKAEIKDDLS